MNRAYKIIFSKAKGMFVVVSELVKSVSTRKKSTLVTAVLALGAALSSTPVLADDSIRVATEVKESTGGQYLKLTDDQLLLGDYQNPTDKTADYRDSDTGKTQIKAKQSVYLAPVYSDPTGAITLQNNALVMDGGIVNAENIYIYGAQSAKISSNQEPDKALNNTVTIYRNEFRCTNSDRCSNSLPSNIRIVGGYAGTAASNNVVNIAGGTYHSTSKAKIIGGVSGGEASNNEINLSGSADLQGVMIYGGSTGSDFSPGSESLNTSSNTLNVGYIRLPDSATNSRGSTGQSVA